MTRVLIVAAYVSVRAGLHTLVAEAEGCAVSGAVSGSEELERLLLEAPPDVVLFDQNESDEARLLAIMERSEAALVVLGERRDGFQELAVRPLKGWAYLLKEADGAEIAGAIRAAAAGLIVLDASLAPLLTPTRPYVAEGQAAAASPAAEGLTAREREVLQLLAEGLPNKQIAARLGITPHTAKFHVASILGKLGAASRTEAVATGARRGLLTL
jgi:DNA-binding NarL/FixJ family response regulator